VHADVSVTGVGNKKKIKI
jgi:hypothetical protein